MKGERNDKAEKPCFYSFGTAEPHPILCKDVANERKESLLLFPECSYILCKDAANERKESLLLFPECSYILCKCTKKNLQSNKNRLNFITLRHHPLRSPRTRASASAAVRSNGPLCSSFNVHMAAANRPASE